MRLMSGMQQYTESARQTNNLLAEDQSGHAIVFIGQTEPFRVVPQGSC